MRKSRFKCGLLIILVAFFFLSGCTHSSSTRPRTIHVTASVNFYGDVAKAVLGDHGRVSSLIRTSGVDPHDFQPTPKDAETISKSNVVLMNGLGYDQWFRDLTRDVPHAKLISVGNLINKRTGDNPHVWYRTQTMPKLANDLANQFGRIEPEHRQDFKRNAKRYVDSLRPVNVLLNRLRWHVRKRQVDVTEPVFDYSLHDLGYRIHDHGYSKAIEIGIDPTPEEIRGVQTDLKNHRVAFLVQNVQTSNSLTRHLVRLARQHHVPILKVSETMPNRKNYRSWMLKQDLQLAKIQKN